MLSFQSKEGVISEIVAFNCFSYVEEGAFLSTSPQSELKNPPRLETKEISRRSYALLFFQFL